LVCARPGLKGGADAAKKEVIDEEDLESGGSHLARRSIISAGLSESADTDNTPWRTCRCLAYAHGMKSKRFSTGQNKRPPGYCLNDTGAMRLILRRHFLKVSTAIPIYDHTP
jgi:hypothetical protein